MNVNKMAFLPIGNISVNNLSTMVHILNSFRQLYILHGGGGGHLA
jgi:hypothetical protein